MVSLQARTKLANSYLPYIILYEHTINALSTNIVTGQSCLHPVQNFAIERSDQNIRFEMDQNPERCIVYKISRTQDKFTKECTFLEVAVNVGVIAGWLP